MKKIEDFSKKNAKMLAGSEKVTTFASAFKKNGCSYKDWKFTIKELKALCKRDFPKRKVLEKDFWKKICRIKKDDLSLQSLSQMSRKRPRKKIFKKDLVDSKITLIFAIPFATKMRSFFKLVLWITGYILREKKCSIYLSIFLLRINE